MLHLNTAFLETNENRVVIQLLLWSDTQHLVVHPTVVFWPVLIQLSADLHVAPQSCLHFREVPQASSKHSLGKVSTGRTHSVAARHPNNYLTSC